MAWTVKNLPAMQRTQTRSLGQEDSLEKGMETHSSILAWKIPCTEEPGRLQFMGSHRVAHERSDLAAAATEHTGKKSEKLSKSTGLSPSNIVTSRPIMGV